MRCRLLVAYSVDSVVIIIIIIIIIIIDFHWGLINSKFPYIFNIHLRILADFFV